MPAIITSLLVAAAWEFVALKLIGHGLARIVERGGRTMRHVTPAGRGVQLEAGEMEIPKFEPRTTRTTRKAAEILVLFPRFAFALFAWFAVNLTAVNIAIVAKRAAWL